MLEYCRGLAATILQQDVVFAFEFEFEATGFCASAVKSMSVDETPSRSLLSVVRRTANLTRPFLNSCGRGISCLDMESVGTATVSDSATSLNQTSLLRTQRDSEGEGGHGTNNQLTCPSTVLPLLPSSRIDCDKNNRDIIIIINITDFNEMPTPPSMASRPDRELTRCFMILLHTVLTFAVASVRNKQQLYPGKADLLPDFLTFCHITMTVTGRVDKALEPCTNEEIYRDVNLTKDLLLLNVWLLSLFA
ncbi:hypothetical protein IWX90DRAFT_45781 [Phyllosticta citrichinensis]|uniref:Uncharacterized protein n=1 Tax=Phyllosticta citrichinensis TaxID=1130410 RepID=A0ABR1XHS8_9PEZI